MEGKKGQSESFKSFDAFLFPENLDTSHLLPSLHHHLFEYQSIRVFRDMGARRGR